MSDASDDRLAQRAAKGDRRAFEAIYKRYQADLYRFSLAIVGNPEDAQDALQNTMVKALRALPGESRQVRLKPWLYRIARNESIELIRRRRETTEIDEGLAAAPGETAATAETRERLRGLLADLARLPVRQRAALVMRELGGLDFDGIGAALETSPAAARQTVYEARLGLREMERGREMTCEQVMREISDADGRTMRRRDLRAHIRGCPECRAFRDAISGRRRDLAAIAPLPAAASAGLLQAVFGGAAGASGAGGAAGAGAGVAGVGVAGKVASASILAKSAATVAVATVGLGAADRAGLVETPLPGRDDEATTRSVPAGVDGGVRSSGGAGQTSVGPGAGQAVGGRTTPGVATPGAAGEGRGPGQGDSQHGSGQPGGPPGAGPQGPGSDGQGNGPGHGQETAAAHKGGAGGKGQAKSGRGPKAGAGSGGKANAGGASKGKSPGSSKGTSKGGAQGGANTPSQTGSGAADGKSGQPPPKPGPPPPQVKPDNGLAAPLKPPKEPKPGAESNAQTAEETQ